MSKRVLTYIDDWIAIRLADSFVKDNKSGTGNGEASLYLGSKFEPNLFDFFGAIDFDAHCLMLRDDIIEYLDMVKVEYLFHRFNYVNEVSLNTWKRLYNEVLLLPDELFFDLTRKRQHDKHGRVYAQELTYKRSKNLTYQISPKAYVYDLIRRVAIPEVTFLMLTKDGDSNFYSKLYYDPNN